MDAMQIVMMYFYEEDIFGRNFRKEISRQLLEEVMIVSTVYDLYGLLDLAIAKCFVMIDTPRLRFSRRRWSQEAESWSDFALENNLNRVHSRLCLYICNSPF